MSLTFTSEQQQLLSALGLTVWRLRALPSVEPSINMDADVIFFVPEKNEPRVPSERFLRDVAVALGGTDCAVVIDKDLIDTVRILLRAHERALHLSLTTLANGGRTLWRALTNGQ